MRPIGKTLDVLKICAPTRALALALVAALLPLASACPEDPREAQRERPVATIDGEVKIRPTTLLARLSRRGTPRIRGEQTRLVLARQALDGLIEEALLMRAATAANVTLPDDAIDREIQRSAAGYPAGDFAQMLHSEQLTASAYREAVRRRLTIEAYLKAQVREQARVTPEEIEAKYREEIAQETPKEEVLVRQVFVKTREEATHILGEIRARRITLEEAARRYSTAPESENGGALDWFARGEMPEVFDAAFDLEVGNVSEVVASDYGFHLFELIARRAPDAQVPLSVVRDRIAAEIRRSKETKAIKAIVEKLRADANVVVDDRVLASTTAKLPAPPPEVDGGPSDAIAAPPPAPLTPPEDGDDKTDATAVPIVNPPAAPPAQTPPPKAAPVPSKPAVVAPKPVAPKPVSPKPAAPEAVAPKPAAPKPVAPKPVEGKPAAPAPAPAKPAAPKPAPAEKPAPKPPAAEPAKAVPAPAAKKDQE